MADTIITNSPDKNNDSGAGWVVALVLIIAVIAGGILLYQRGAFRRAAPATSSTNINVTMPNPVAPPAAPVDGIPYQ